MKYLHVIRRPTGWHVYPDHGDTVLGLEGTFEAAVRAARTLARRYGAKVVLHKEIENQPAQATPRESVEPRGLSGAKQIPPRLRVDTASRSRL